MNLILKLGTGALTAGMAIAAAGCAKSGAATTNAQPAHSSTPSLSPSQNAEDKMPRVNVEEARRLLAEGKAVIIDVRDADNYKASHIKGALHFPTDKLEAGDLKDLPKDKRIIAYCA